MRRRRLKLDFQEAAAVLQWCQRQTAGALAVAWEAWGAVCFEFVVVIIGRRGLGKTVAISARRASFDVALLISARRASEWILGFLRL